MRASSGLVRLTKPLVSEDLLRSPVASAQDVCQLLATEVIVAVQPMQHSTLEVPSDVLLDSDVGVFCDRIYCTERQVGYRSDGPRTYLLPAAHDLRETYAGTRRRVAL